jgi:hypothetical protein
MYQIFHRKLMRRKKNYFISSIFRSFVIPISDGKQDRHVTSTISVQPDATTPILMKKPAKRRIPKDDD